MHQRAEGRAVRGAPLHRLPDGGAPASGLETEQVAIFLGEDYVLTFQERPGDCLDPVRERIRQGTGRIRVGGPRLPRLRDPRRDRRRLLPRPGDIRRAARGPRGGDPRASPTRGASARAPRQARPPHAPARDLAAARGGQRRSCASRPSSSREDTRLYLRDCYDHTDPAHGPASRPTASSPPGSLDVYMSSVSQPHERGDEGPDDHRHDLHPAHLHRRRLRHELPRTCPSSTGGGPTPRCGASCSRSPSPSSSSSRRRAGSRASSRTRTEMDRDEDRCCSEAPQSAGASLRQRSSAGAVEAGRAGGQGGSRKVGSAERRCRSRWGRGSRSLLVEPPGTSELSSLTSASRSAMSVKIQTPEIQRGVAEPEEQELRLRVALHLRVRLHDLEEELPDLLHVACRRRRRPRRRRGPRGRCGSSSSPAPR